MNQSTRVAREVVQSLIDGGVHDVVVAPGSRSAALAYAAAQAARAGAMRLHVRIDEREAGFLALGLARGGGRPAAVIVTSGSAVANLMPAIVEAYMAAVPVIAVTADRPAEVRFSGAAQTIDQPPMFDSYTAVVVDVPVGAEDLSDVHRAVAAARGSRPQPVHINVQFDLPLMPETDLPAWVPSRREQDPVTTHLAPRGPVLQLPPRGLVIVGDVRDPLAAAQAGQLANELCWPLLWEPSGNAHRAPTAVSHGALIAAHLPRPDAVITVGTVGLSRPIMALLRSTPEHIAVHLPTNGPMVPDPVRSARQIVDAVPAGTTTPDPEWLAAWRTAEVIAAELVSRALDTPALTGPSVARALWHRLGPDGQLVVAASWAVRHVEAYAEAAAGPRVHGNRGANGIDGLVSTAAGVALATSRRTHLLVGDVAFLYGAGGLLGAGEADLTLVVLDNDGSGIFSQLEQGDPRYQEHFEQVFGTPHERDLWVVAEAYGVPSTRVTTRSELDAALDRADAVPGPHVIVCTTGTRTAEASQVVALRDGVAAALQ